MLKVNKSIVYSHIYDIKRFNDDNIKNLSEAIKIHNNLESFHFEIKRCIPESSINLLIN